MATAPRRVEDYTIYEVLSRGHRFTYGFGPEEAIASYLKMHPERVEAEVRAELDEALAKRGETHATWAPYFPDVVVKRPER